jgi:hypothetical protein
MNVLTLIAAAVVFAIDRPITVLTLEAVPASTATALVPTEATGASLNVAML